LELTAEQEAYADRIASTCRTVWNIGLEQRREYRRRGKWISYPEQAHELADAKDEHPWLADAPSHCLQQTLMDLDKACRAHGPSGVRWRSARRWRPSFRFPEGNKMLVEKLNRQHARVTLPKLGWVRFRLSRSLDGALIRSATVIREGGHWFISFLVDDAITTPTQHAAPGSAVGVDRGVVVAVAGSDGRLVNRDFVTAGELPRALRLQRRLACAAKQSRNRAKTREALSAIRARERHRRQDFCNQTAHQLAVRHGLVVIEGPQDQPDDSLGERKHRGTRDQRQGQIRPQPRHLVQGVAPVHAGTVVDGPLHRDPCRDRAAASHVATLLDLWSGGPEIP
jgi:putative transposase